MQHSDTVNIQLNSAPRLWGTATWQRLKSYDKTRLAFMVKWVASIIQILGYTATAAGMTPLNIYFFLVGLVGWLFVGLIWQDRAIILIHLIALGSMVVGLLS